MAISFMVMIPLLLILLIVFIIAGFRGDTKQGGEVMIKNVYIYLVLFATLMMTIGGSVGAFMAIADIVAPTTYHQSFEEFKQWGSHKHPDREMEEVLTEEQLRERYEAMVATEKERVISRAKNSLIKSFGWIIIPLPVFIYFQKRLNRIKET